MIPLRLLAITAVIVLASTKEIVAPVRIASYTNFKMEEKMSKMDIESEERQRIEQEIKGKIYAYITNLEVRGYTPSGEYTCPFIKEVGDIIYYCSKKYNIPISLIMAIIEKESSWIIDAISNYGARGLMQVVLRYPNGEMLWQCVLISNDILPPSEKNDICDINIMKPRINIEAGCYIFDHYRKQVYFNHPEYEILADEYLTSVLNRYSGGGGDRYINKIYAAWWKIEKCMSGE